MSVYHKRLYRDYIKRCLDIILSLIAVILLSPVLLITAILVRVKLGSPVIFKQPRPGKNEKIFYLYKFRSMTNETGEDGKLLPDAQRLTKFGKILRATSIDELPELLNIVMGDMSIVGPRPLSIYYLPHYSNEHRNRHNVRPGLTGLAQVNGRNNLPWDERFAYDIQYVENVSFLFDAKIVIQTALKVLKKSNISVRGTTKVKDFGPYRILQIEGKDGMKKDGMTYSEIGSYFWLDDSEPAGIDSDPKFLPECDDSAFTFSGRTAIDLVFRDICHHIRVKHVYVPAYSCVSMCQAFIDHGFKLRFYPVSYKDGKFQYHMPEVEAGDVVLIMSYFGLQTETERNMITKLHERGAIVIEDITHSLLRSDAASEQADYMIASLRKWFAIPSGGWMGKRNGQFHVKPSISSDHAVQQKIDGMRQKYAYLVGEQSNKEEYLFAQSTFDNDLIHVDRMLKIDKLSYQILSNLDLAQLMETRKRNVQILLDGLREIHSSMISLPAVNPDTDTLLFLPIFLPTEQRNSLRAFLLSNSVYCPIHWPETMGTPEGVRENELSIICDQRYSVSDMKAIVKLIDMWDKQYHTEGE